MSSGIRLFPGLTMARRTKKKGKDMNTGIIKRNQIAALVNMGEYGYWVVAKIGGKPVRLFAGGTLDKGERVFNFYRKES